LALDSGWTLSAGAFDRLLAILSDDREQAAEAYGQLRHRIAGLHRWWGAHDPDTLADVTLDRAARKLQEGAPVDRHGFGAYVRGVARMVFLESTRQPVAVALDRDPALGSAPVADEAPLNCLDECLAGLAADDRRLVLRYYDGSNQIATRQQLARQLDISPTALRIRTHRIRGRLEACVASCLKRS
jgi:DNA-directed RNA polymerase specialized sigma24 family protein